MGACVGRLGVAVGDFKLDATTVGSIIDSPLSLCEIAKKSSKRMLAPNTYALILIPLGLLFIGAGGDGGEGGEGGGGGGGVWRSRKIGVRGRARCVRPACNQLPGDSVDTLKRERV